MKKDFKTSMNKEEKNGLKQGDFEETLIIEETGTLNFDPNAELNMIWFTFDGIGLTIAHKLMQEGNNVVVAHVQNKKDLGEDGEEDPEMKRRRLSLYDGIIKKYDAVKVLKDMAKLKDKDNWIVFFDFNNMGLLAEKALEMGFTRGLFPTTEDTELEKDRDAAKDIVKEFYPDLSVAEVHEFKSAEDGIEHLMETDKLWVLKGNSDNAKTLVPANDDPELAKSILIDALEAHTKDYEDGGFILEEKIVNGWELTPQIVFLDGEPIFTDIDIENKNIGSGNVSVQTGAMQTLVVKTELEDEINRIAFPEWIYEKAKATVGLFVCDAGIICKDDKYYFTEFCFNRFGWDSIFAEIEMSGSATEHFLNIFAGNNPLVKNFGVAVRGLNMHKDDKERRVLEGVSMTIGEPEHTFVFECKEEDNKYIVTGGAWDMVVFSGAGETVNEAAEQAYNASEQFAFEDLYLRPLFDFMSTEYQNSIPNRYTELNGKLFSAEPIHEKNVDIDILIKQAQQLINEQE